ncbi:MULTISPECIES: TolC family protein [unclassified Helicobacter]|uniref:TolC family protein n=1 Tax=unclassified Helicobacter TaxID=2593540 RepID=UPI000CF0F19A|nr:MULTISPECIES: TolC family protein [unclassified Helicobacter]
MLKLIPLIFGLLFIGVAKDLSMQEAWEYVLEHNDGIKAEELGVKRQEKLTLSSKLSFLPVIDFTASYIHLADTIGLSTVETKNKIIGSVGNGVGTSLLQGILDHIPNKIDFVKQDIIVGSLNIIYPLYTGGKRIYATRISKLQEKDAIEALRLKKLATFEELVKIYYGVWLQQEVLQTLQDIENGAKIHYQNAQKLQKAGQIAKLEVLGAQVALDKAMNKTKETQNALEVSQMALNIVLGLDGVNPSSKIIVPRKLIGENESFFVQKTLDSYPILKSLDQKVLITKQLYKIEVSKFLPEVALSGSYFVNNNFLLNQSLPSWYVGITARMPLITPGGRIPQLQATKITQMQLDKTKSQATKDMELLVKRTYKEMQFAQQEYWSLNSSIELAKENLKLQEKAFTQGLATSIQVTDARNMLASVLIEQKTIAYKYVILLSKLMAVSDSIAMFYEIQR